MHRFLLCRPTRDRRFKRDFVVTNVIDLRPTDVRQTMYPLRAVDRVCDIIDLLAEHPGGITLSGLAATVGLPKSSAFRYLAALEARGYVVRSADGVGYRLGSPVDGAQPIGPGRLERLVTVARPLMARLTSSDIPVCMLAVLDGPGIRYLSVASTLTADPRVPKTGDRGLMHATAVGKAVASQLADETVLALVSTVGMPQATPSTLGTPTGLLRELHRIRGEGFAMSENERHSDVRGVAVPIGGDPIALGIAARVDQLTPDRVGGAVRQLRRAAVVLARELRG